MNHQQNATQPPMTGISTPLLSPAPAGVTRRDGMCGGLVYELQITPTIRRAVATLIHDEDGWHVLAGREGGDHEFFSEAEAHVYRIALATAIKTAAGFWADRDRLEYALIAQTRDAVAQQPRQLAAAS